MPFELAVLGSTLRDELFGLANPLGARIRIGGDRYRVIGIMESKGNMLGVDKIHEWAEKLGLVGLTGIDLPNEQENIVPSTEWKL